jgi:hypothetical protein
MNFQDVLKPIEEFMVWTFETLLEPIGNSFNVLVTIGIVAGIGIWLRMQSRYNAEAERNNTLK